MKQAASMVMLTKTMAHSSVTCCIVTCRHPAVRKKAISSARWLATDSVIQSQKTSGRYQVGIVSVDLLFLVDVFCIEHYINRMNMPSKRQSPLFKQLHNAKKGNAAAFLQVGVDTTCDFFTKIAVCSRDRNGSQHFSSSIVSRQRQAPLPCQRM